MNYSIKLISYNFDNKYDDVRLFENRAEQSLFFDNQPGTIIENVNLDANNLINMNLTVQAPDLKLIDLLNYNYCIISNKNTNEKIYCWINESRQASGGIIVIKCEIDPLQTYLNDLTFEQCLINRAHIDRFESAGGELVRFDGKAISPLFEREDFKNVSKRLVERRRLKMKIDKATEVVESDFDNYAINKSIGWVYVYLSSGTYNFNDIFGNPIKVPLANISYYKGNLRQEGGTSVLCYPLNSSLNLINKSDLNVERPIEISSKGFENFLRGNSEIGASAKIYAIKYSNMPPFENLNYQNKYIIKNDKIYLISNNDDTKVYFYGNDLEIIKTNEDPGNNYGLINVRAQNLEPKLLFTESNLFQNKFSKSEVINAGNDPLYNPKLLNEDYSELELSIGGNTYSYDMQKLNNSKPEFLYYEALTPDITKSLVVYKAENVHDIFIPETKNNYSGLLSTQDNSVLFSSSNLEQFLSTNKNAFLSFQTNQLFAAAKGISGAISKGSSSSAFGGPTDPILAGIGFVNGLINTGLNLAENEIKFDLSIDNMRSAPNNLVNANGNAIFLNAVSDIGIYINIFKIIPNEQILINELMHQFGFVVNKIAQPREFFNTRKNFNYIKCALTNIEGKVSNEIKRRISAIFEKGVRLWHIDKIDFTKQNFERWLQ